LSEQLVYKISTYVLLINQRHRQTDGQTTCDCKTALCTIVYRAVIIIIRLV